jgi:CheY-like chemotaxis protein
LSVRILFVDDDELLAETLSMLLEDAARDWTIAVAHNGLEAIERLEESVFDVLVTDLQMPLMDGVALLAELKSLKISIPVVVLTVNAHQMADTKGLQVLQKPVNVEALRRAIERAAAEAASGEIQGISLESFLQVLHQERKTVSLELTLGVDVGELHLVGGDIIDASVGGLEGRDAALLLATWSAAKIHVLPGVRVRQRRIEDRMDYILLESMRLKDHNELPTFRTSPIESDFSSMNSGIAAASPGLVRQSFESKAQPAHFSSLLPPSMEPPAMSIPAGPPPLSVETPLETLLRKPGIDGVLVTSKPGLTPVVNEKMPKPSVDRAQYVERLAQLLGKELGLERLQQVTVTGRTRGLLIRDGIKGKSIVEVNASVDVNELAFALQEIGF